MPPFDKPKLRLVPQSPTDDDGEELIVTHHADDELLLFRTFRAYVKNIRTDFTGELTLTMGVVPEDKGDAFALTDFTGLVFTFDAYFRPRRSRTTVENDTDDDDSDDEFGDGDDG